mgnify:CR=1 FL=1
MTEIETGGPRRRGRERQAAGPRSRLPEQKAFRQPRMKYAPTKVISDDEVEAIHHASLRVLSDIGIDFLLPEALKSDFSIAIIILSLILFNVFRPETCNGPSIRKFGC